MDDLLQFLPIALACVVVPLSVLFWLLALERTSRGVPLLPSSARRPVPWTIGDLLALMLAGTVITSTTQILMAQQFGVPLDKLQLADLPLQPRQQVVLLAGFSVGTVLMWCFSLLWLRWRAGASRDDLGWPQGTWASDLVLGLVAFLMLVVPMLGIHFLVQRMWRTEATHPFIEIVVRDPRPLFLIPVIVAGVGVAPVVEEFLFRVYLQGWLERLPSPWAWWHGSMQPPEVRRPSPAAECGPDVVAAEWISAAAPPAAAPPHVDTQAGPAREEGWADAYRPPHVADSLAAAPATPGPDPTHPPSPWWPVGASGLLFAVAHIGQGPAPIPLFFLGLGLGYLYHRTHRVLPCIVVHFLVNLTAVAQLAMYVAQHKTVE